MYWPWMPNAGSCAGEEFAAFSGIAILSSYLFLFISFYVATYKKEGKRPSGRKAVRRMSQAEMPNPNDIIHGKANSDVKASGFTTNGTATRSRKA